MEPHQKAVLAELEIDLYRLNTDETHVPESEATLSVYYSRCQSGGVDWLWVFDPASSASAQQLLDKIILAVKHRVQKQESLTVSTLMSLQSAVMVCLGETLLAQQLPEAACTIGWRGQLQTGSHVLITHALVDMLENPSTKKVVWRDLQKLQADLTTPR